MSWRAVPSRRAACCIALRSPTHSDCPREVAARCDAPCTRHDSQGGQDAGVPPDLQFGKGWGPTFHRTPAVLVGEIPCSVFPRAGSSSSSPSKGMHPVVSLRQGQYRVPQPSRARHLGISKFKICCSHSNRHNGRTRCSV
jgi:hypothetical protein